MWCAGRSALRLHLAEDARCLQLSTLRQAGQSPRQCSAGTAAPTLPQVALPNRGSWRRSQRLGTAARVMDTHQRVEAAACAGPWNIIGSRCLGRQKSRQLVTETKRTGVLMKASEPNVAETTSERIARKGIFVARVAVCSKWKKWNEGSQRALTLEEAPRGTA